MCSTSNLEICCVVVAESVFVLLYDRYFLAASIFHHSLPAVFFPFFHHMSIPVSLMSEKLVTILSLLEYMRNRSQFHPKTAVEQIISGFFPIFRLYPEPSPPLHPQTAKTGICLLRGPS
ncbi:hypothetical protein CAOG_009360 [Capsaspora owczarzaki ATCC 30864]|uniref:Uncharacterized protein n=1 Tax=Capsaspora owczarzaki (strain ATCC 30864) TaxID=595528 RepID=A0A0D2X0P7_CAPO3|nr:hypothetical protein CAOG_009360 [Capsaspora owczarzaki ATCC 30864]